MDSVALLQIVLTFVITVATVVYAALTYILVKETRRLREVQTQPDIAVYLETSENSNAGYDIVVRNVGAGAAYSLIWSMDQNSPLVTDDIKGLGKLKFFEGVAYFAPGQIFRSFIGMGWQLLRLPIPPALTINLTYDDCDGKQHMREFTIDPMQFYGRVKLSGHSARDVADSIKKMEKNLDRLVSGSSRVKVDLYDRADRDEERRTREEWIENSSLRNRTKETSGANDASDELPLSGDAEQTTLDDIEPPMLPSNSC